MSFEEQFPSLNGQELGRPWTDEPVFLQSAIVESCLDKQRVREAIEKVQCDESGKGDYFLAVSALKKELGL